MLSLVLMATGDKRDDRDLCTLLEKHGYRMHHSRSLEELGPQLRESRCRMLLLDLDHLSIDNRTIRELSKQHAGLSIIALSSRTYHPELEEALSSHISACLVKPVDIDELLFWVRSLGERKHGHADAQGA
jgi:DNA-binding response OmpR family regulator